VGKIILFFKKFETDLDQKSQETRDCLGSCDLAKMDQRYGVKMPHWMRCKFLGWLSSLGQNVTGKVDTKYAMDNMSQMQVGRTVHPVFGGRYEWFWGGRTVCPLSCSLGMQCYCAHCEHGSRNTVDYTCGSKCR
jgi:hypothetical protein